MNTRKFLTLSAVIGILFLSGCAVTPYYGGTSHFRGNGYTYGYQAPHYGSRNYLNNYPYYNNRNSHSSGWHLHGRHNHHMHGGDSHHNRGGHKHFGGGHRGNGHIRTHHH